MNIATAALMVVLGALTVLGWQEVNREQQERIARVSQMEAISHIDSAFQEWQTTTRGNTDARGFTVPTLAEFTRFATEYLPSDALTGIGLTAAAAGTNAFVIDNVTLGPVDRIGVSWPGGGVPSPEVEVRLLGGWFDEEVAFFQGVMPHAALECSPAALCPGGSTPVPAAFQAPGGGLTRSIVLSVRHTASSVVASNLPRRFITTEAIGGDVEGLLTPLVYEPPAVVTLGDPCGLDSAQGVNANGIPMMCADIDSDGTREWVPSVATNIYCRDTSLLPSNAAYTSNMPGVTPVIEVAPIAAITPTPLHVSVRGTVVNGTLVCPVGFTQVPLSVDLCEQPR